MVLKKIAVVTVFFLCFFLLPSGAGAKSDNSHKVYQLPPYKVEEYIRKTKGKKRILFLYASWCPYCVEEMPKIMDIERAQKGSVIAVSIDRDHMYFARYLRRYENIPFHVILHKGSKEKLINLAAKFGGEPWTGSVPYTIWFDEENNLVSQGNYSAEKSADFLFTNKYKKNK